MYKAKNESWSFEQQAREFGCDDYGADGKTFGWEQQNVLVSLEHVIVVDVGHQLKQIQR